MMTAQQIFDKIVRHLRKQGHKAKNGDVCTYLALDGSKCAAGCLILKSEYDPCFENKKFGYVWHQIPSLQERVNLGDVGLVEALQRVHDAADVSEWENKFQGVAKIYGLTYKPPRHKTI